MLQPDFVLLYVDNPLRSTEFYRKLLQIEPAGLHPTFALFALQSGLNLGLWSQHTPQPAVSMTGGGGEIAFTVTSKAEVDKLYQEWPQLGLTILQKPTEMDFGYTYVGMDPDRHRLRIFCAH